MHRGEEQGDATDLPPALPEAWVDGDLQPIEEGVGPLFHRLYRVRIREARLSPDEVIGSLRVDPNRAAPTELARFLKARDAHGRFGVGDLWVGQPELSRERDGHAGLRVLPVNPDHPEPAAGGLVHALQDRRLGAARST